ncbi:MAG: thioredoxin family protein [Acidiferrobacterales bacterium]
MIERLLITVVLIVLGALAYWSWTRYQLGSIKPNAPGLESRRRGVPSILYFTAPGCAPCRTVQRPALQSLEAQYDDQLQVITVDAMEQTEIANHWRVVSVPTTFVLDSSGAPQAVNMGVARTDKLQRQLANIGLT